MFELAVIHVLHNGNDIDSVILRVKEPTGEGVGGMKSSSPEVVNAVAELMAVFEREHRERALTYEVAGV